MFSLVQNTLRFTGFDTYCCTCFSTVYAPVGHVLVPVRCLVMHFPPMMPLLWVPLVLSCGSLDV